METKLVCGLGEMTQSVDLSHWQIKDMIWIKDCPAPHDEEFKRVGKLWERI